MRVPQDADVGGARDLRGEAMNTQFLTEFKAALVALLAVLNSTNSPVK